MENKYYSDLDKSTPKWVYGLLLGVLFGGFMFSMYSIGKKEVHQELESKLEKLADTNGVGGLSEDECKARDLAMYGEKEKTLDYRPTLKELKKGIAYFEKLQKDSSMSYNY